jgi:hypothetical protein
VNKDVYRLACEREPDIPLFSRPWWLDATAGELGWDVALIHDQGGNILASMPYTDERRYGLRMSSQPPFTQVLGPWIRTADAPSHKLLAGEKDLFQALIDQLPPFDSFTQNWHYSRTNWLPFYWRGFRQTTRYTYLLPDLTNADALWAGMGSNIKGDIKKASGRFGLKVRTDLTLDDFMKLNRMVFERQGKALPYEEAIIARLDAACAERGVRRIFIAEDDEGRHHAGVYVVWDADSAYYLMGGGDPELRKSGATSLCLWEAIKFASTVTRKFDFEGSMIESVERFFRAFGAEQTPYFQVSRDSSLLWRTARFAMSLKRGKGG